MNVGNDNVEGVMEETADIADTVEDLNELDVEYIAEIMEKTARTTRMSKFVSNNIGIHEVYDTVCKIFKDFFSFLTKISSRVLTSEIIKFNNT